MENGIQRYRRYLRFLLVWILKEKPRGLDFTMRKKASESEFAAGYHGYSVTPEMHFRKVMSYFIISPTDNFLDVGCGKGSVLKLASEYPFGRIEGVEYQADLAQIARKNLKKLALDTRISIVCMDALKYNDYDMFQYFYLFNPFGEDLFSKFLDIVAESIANKPRSIVLIYHNPLYHELVLKSNLFKLKYEEYDHLKNYWTYIYQYEYNKKESV
ncbi:methyltransferase domain-containing protein [Anoxybacterium hadale]|uniref:Methyltransferase domain-containing protein n=1 Tax=Anoxybacterium hadale TaxID=3408580 RepID=A0ACD1AET2_9FIRM|nr:methyltransferase domain-containing protein [Clostridiales bacterium]